jgi:RNA polymerase sigma factor (sigma-70 family)
VVQLDLTQAELPHTFFLKKQGLIKSGMQHLIRFFRPILEIQLMNGKIMDPEAILSSDKILGKIEAVCKRHFSAENDQNECYVFVIDGLKAEGFKRLRAYEGRSKLNTYIYSLVNSLVIDFRRKRYGRRRIPVGVTKLGKWAETVYRLVCWQRFSLGDAYEFVRIGGLFEGSYVQYMKEIAPIRNAPCRENPAFQSMDAIGGSPLHRIADSGSNPLEYLIQKLDREKRIKAIKVIREITKGLSEKDQLLIRLVYGADQPVSVAAKVIDLATSATRKRLKGLLAKYREGLLAEGIRKP